MARVRDFMSRWPIWSATVAVLLGLGIGGAGAVSARLATDQALAEAKRTAETLATNQQQFSSLRQHFSTLNSEVADLRADLEKAESKLRARVLLANYVGKQLSDVRDRIERRGWDLVVKKRESSRAKGTILAQSPDPGTLMSLDRNVVLVVAKPIEVAAPSVSCPNGTYRNADGDEVCSPYASPTVPPGATARCADGTYSFSRHRQGTCSYHGGVADWL